MPQPHPHLNATPGRQTARFVRPASLVLLALLAGTAAPVVADSALEERIDAQREEIASTEEEREAAREALADLQKRMDFLEEKANELDAERGELETRQRNLDQREAELREGLARRRAELERRLQLAYPLTRGSALQAVLGDGDALQTERDLHYLRALIRPVEQARRALEAQRAELDENRAAIASTDRKLKAASERLDQHYTDVSENLAEQQRLLASLGEALDQQQQELKDLLERKQRLDREVAAAREADRIEEERRRTEREEAEKQARQQAEKQSESASRETTPDEIRDDGSIPIAGRIERRFGETLPQGRLRNDGVIFHAGGASAVRAVDGGRVAFAGTLKGWGQLVMLRHDGDYLSLYAHCRSLDVAKGDRVSRGDRLCTSGVIDAGQEGLYVEVRRGNRPIDPGRWPAWRRAVDG
ncbi:MAG: murein hydrolase activator EnvC family protein [Guyparkeria sp.]